MKTKVLDRVYMMVCPRGEGIIYSVPRNHPREVWEDVADTEFLGTGQDRAYLRKQGYRVRKVAVVLESK